MKSQGNQRNHSVFALDTYIYIWIYMVYIYIYTYIYIYIHIETYMYVSDENNYITLHCRIVSVCNIYLHNTTTSICICFLYTYHVLIYIYTHHDFFYAHTSLNSVQDGRLVLSRRGALVPLA